MNARMLTTLLTLALLSSAGALSYGQSVDAPSSLPDAAPAAERSIEDLNMVGAAITLPPISDTVLGAESSFRRALFSEGFLFRIVSMSTYTQNLLAAPVPADQQVYVGQRPTEGWGMVSLFTADLRQFGLHHAQLNIAGVWDWTSWNSNGPKTFSLMNLYFYKMWGDHLVEVKAGYLLNDPEFVGLQVGGSGATGLQGVYQVLPFELGMSNFPLTAPAFNLRLRGPKDTYFKTGAQRSLDAAGGPATAARNLAGTRFMPKGDKLLLINEAGYRRAASEVAHEVWFRAGYMHNSTPYTDLVTGRKEPGNYCAYALMDYQLHADPQDPGHGIYIGGSAMTTPAKFNHYDRDYEGRLYKKAPFRSRPGDVLVFVVSHTGYSRYYTDQQAADGMTPWHSATSFTSTYVVHVHQGSYLSLGLSHMQGPAITPHVPSALGFNAVWTVFL